MQFFVDLLYKRSSIDDKHSICCRIVAVADFKALAIHRCTFESHHGCYNISMIWTYPVWLPECPFLHWESLGSSTHKRANIRRTVAPHTNKLIYAAQHLVLLGSGYSTKSPTSLFTSLSQIQRWIIQTWTCWLIRGWEKRLSWNESENYMAASYLFYILCFSFFIFWFLF